MRARSVDHEALREHRRHHIMGISHILGDIAEDVGDAHDVVAAMLAEGFVINATGPHTLRFLPPLICGTADIDRLISALTRVLA